MAERNFCPLEYAIERIGGKWKVLILWRLRNGVMRFAELQRAMPGVTQKMLAQQLRELENGGLIIRKVYPEVPPRVEYSLSESGEAFKPLMLLLNDWGRELHEKSLSFEKMNNP